MKQFQCPKCSYPVEQSRCENCGHVFISLSEDTKLPVKKDKKKSSIN